jgi:ectoine hydroxylase
MFTDKDLETFNKQGYLIVRSLFAKEEVQALRSFAESNDSLKESTFSKGDGEGGSIDMALWNNVDDSLFGLFPRSERLVNRMEQLTGDEVYHYHSKLIQKNPGTGGAWTWHQDYGYWYQNGLLYADKVASVMVAVDQATKENGCLQVIEGSHNIGRIDHLLTGEQAGADMEVVNAAKAQLPHIHVELEQGDALFFHSNLLHRSDQNKSTKPRWALISCYNSKSNNPFKKSHHPEYSPLKKVKDEDVLKGLTNGNANLDWLSHDKDRSASILEKDK